MKCNKLILSLLAAVTGAAAAADISYNGYTQTSSSRDGQVKGAALSSDGEVTISGYGNVSFTDNLTKNSYTSSHSTTDADLAVGGAVYAGTSVTISGNIGDITFSDNELRAKTTNDARTRVRGGAIKGGTISILDNAGGEISFLGNQAADDYKAWDATVGAQVDKPRFSAGGAIYADTELTVSGNGNISFSTNEAGKGGAISAGYGSVMTLAGNGTVSFSDNKAENGGAAYTGVYIYKNGSNTAGSAELNITGNSRVSFTGNEARNNGGAIYNQSNSTVNISSNTGDVLFSGNKAVLYGGAIRGQSGSTILLDSNTGTVSFTGNSVTRADVTNIYGGAISTDAGSTVSMSMNRSVNLSDNIAQTNSSAYGGAVAVYNSSLSINENTHGVTICGNMLEATKTSSWGGGVSAEGGAIYGKTLYIQNNAGTVNVSGNIAKTINNGTARGGAFYIQDTLAITGNDKVEFRGNVQQSSDRTILRSVYLDSKSANGALRLSAAEGGSITFYDSLYAAPNSSSYGLSVDFNGEAGETGSIVFSGKYAAGDLLAIDSGTSQAAIELSRTSTVLSAINLHRGTLSVQEQAVLQSSGLTVMSGATLSLQDGMLEMLNNTSFTLRENGVFKAQGANVLTAATLDFANGSTFDITLGEINKDNALMKLTASSLSYGSAQLNFNELNQLAEGEYMLLDLSPSTSLTAMDWNTESFSITGLSAGDSFRWSDDGTQLYLVHTILPIPEPTTATLSLLALAGLAARRRRR